MPQITITLTDEQAETLDAAVVSGEYTSTQQAMEVAFSQWETNRFIESQGPEFIEYARAAWDEGIASGPGKPLDWDELHEQVRRRVTERTPLAG